MGEPDDLSWKLPNFCRSIFLNVTIIVKGEIIDNEQKGTETNGDLPAVRAVQLFRMPSDNIFLNQWLIIIMQVGVKKQEVTLKTALNYTYIPGKKALIFCHYHLYRTAKYLNQSKK